MRGSRLKEERGTGPETEETHHRRDHPHFARGRRRQGPGGGLPQAQRVSGQLLPLEKEVWRDGTERRPQVPAVEKGIENLIGAGGRGKRDIRGCFPRPSSTFADVAAARLRKHGHADNDAQQAKCLDCKRTFILQFKGDRCDHKFKDQVAAYQGCMRLRGITRTFGTRRNTILHWVEKKAANLPDFVDTPLPAKRGDVLKPDELWNFVGHKARLLWLWVAQCRRTRQTVGWTLGDLTLPSACDLRTALTPSLPPVRCARRQVEGLRGSFPRPYVPLLRESGRRDLPHRTLARDPAGETQSPCAPDLLLL